MNDYYTVHTLSKKLGLAKVTIWKWVRKLKLGKLILSPAGCSLRVFTDADYLAIKNRVDGRTTRWSRAKGGAG